MSRLPHPASKPIPDGEKEDDPVGEFTRRTVLAGAAAATAVISVGAVDRASAQTRQDMVLFVLLSGALTGIAEGKLAPGSRLVVVPSSTNIDLEKSEPGSDPVDIKQEYFNWLNKRRPAAFRRLLQIARESLSSSDRAQFIIDKVQVAPETKYLARSIVLMWYLGAWYDPDHLRALVERPNPPPAKFEVISPKAYTQGWALRVAQAHPMGFSEMQFGYWSRPPSPRTDFIGK
jgi:hypothetical protein